MYEIEFTALAKRQLAKLERHVQERILKALERIRVRLEAYITRLVGDPGYKFRVGDYRVLLDVEHQRLLILVLKVGHRSTVSGEMATLALARGAFKGVSAEGIREKRDRTF